MEGAGRTGASLQHQEHVWQKVGAQSISTRQVHVQVGKPWVTVPDWAGSNLLWDKGVWSTDPQVQAWILRLGHLIATHGNCVPRAIPPRPGSPGKWKRKLAFQPTLNSAGTLGWVHWWNLPPKHFHCLNRISAELPQPVKKIRRANIKYWHLFELWILLYMETRHFYVPFHL